MSSSITERSSKQAVKTLRTQKKHGRKVIETSDEIACRGKSETDKACMLRGEFSKQVKGAVQGSRNVLKRQRHIV